MITRRQFTQSTLLFPAGASLAGIANFATAQINGEEKNIEVDGDLTIYGIGRAFKVHPKIEIN